MFGFKKKIKDKKEKKKEKEKLSNDELTRLDHLQSVYGRFVKLQPGGEVDQVSNPGSMTSTPATSQHNLSLSSSSSHYQSKASRPSADFVQDPPYRSPPYSDPYQTAPPPGSSSQLRHVQPPTIPKRPAPSTPTEILTTAPPLSTSSHSHPDSPLTREADQYSELVYDDADKPPSSLSRSSGTLMGLRLPSLACLSPSSPPRQIEIERSGAGDFGFLLRRGVLLHRYLSGDGVLQEIRKQIVLAEPIGDGKKSGLLPGDRLVGVNEVNVEDMTREEIVSVIREKGNRITLSVTSLPELAEVGHRPVLGSTEMGRRAGSYGFSGCVRVDTRDWLKQNASLQNVYRQANRFMLMNGDHSTSESEMEEKGGRMTNGTAGAEGERVWVVYRDAYSGAVLVEEGSEGERCTVVMDQDGRRLQFNEDQIELANPTQQDRCENLSSLRHLNDFSVLHHLRLRYAGNLVHTYAGQSLILLNPMTQLAIYSEKVMQLFRGCRQEDMPPHVFATAQSALRNLLSSRQTQVILPLGSSGAGKSQAEKHMMAYLIHATGTSAEGTVTAEKAVALSTLMEAFTSCRSHQNISATRCCRVTSLHIPETPQELSGIAGIHTQILMLEKGRLGRKADGERTFNVFYQMLAGLDPTLRNELFLMQFDENNHFISPVQDAEEHQLAERSWEKLGIAASLLDITEAEWKAICRVLAAIVHLGDAGAIRISDTDSLAAVQKIPPQYQPTTRCYFDKPRSAQKAAALLGMSTDQLARFVFDPSVSESCAAPTSSRGGLSSTPEHRPANGDANDHMTYTPMELLQGFVGGLYGELVQMMVYLCNRCLSNGSRSLHSITLVDSPGFQNPISGISGSKGATFEDLCFNYLHERLINLAHDININAKRIKYEATSSGETEENIHAEWLDDLDSSPVELLAFLDKNRQQSGRSVASPNRENDGKGLFWILDEEALTGSDETFIRRIQSIYQEHKHHTKDKTRRILKRVSKSSANITLNHCMGAHQVQYNVAGWIKHSREPPTARNAQILLAECRYDILRELASQISNSSQTLRRGNRGASSSTLRQKCIFSQVKSQTDYIVDFSRRAGGVHLIYCLLPVHRAGLCDLPQPAQPSYNDRGECPTPVATPPAVGFSVPLIRDQLVAYQIVSMVRAHRQGYPDNMAFGDFRRRFESLLPAEERALSPVLDERGAVEILIPKLNLDPNSYKIGLSQIFLRAGVAAQLEDQWNDNISTNIVYFQAYCRGYLARRKLQTLKVQHKAIQCIQRNAAKYLEIREWSWWRLFSRITPLLKVQRSEEEVRMTAERLDQLATRADKLEKERTQNKALIQNLEQQVSELHSEMQEERTVISNTADQLEDEREHRIKTERELEDLKVRYERMRSRNQELENDVIEAKKWQQHQMQSSQVFRDNGDDDVAVEDAVYRDRYKRALQEVDMTRKQMQMKEAEMDEEVEKIKRQAERRVTEHLEEADRLESDLSANKRRLNKLQSELGDTKVQLAEAESRCGELERKQKRFDTELARAVTTGHQETTLRECLQRERDQAITERLTVERQLQEAQSDLELQSEKVSRLTLQLNEVTQAGDAGSLEQEVSLLKRGRVEMEQRMKETEEELDEQAATIETLKQSKLRLEMGCEKLRQQQTKELEERDRELETMKTNSQRRIRQLEEQLEEEREERQKLVKEKRDVDRQLNELVGREPQRDRDAERKMKKDLKKTKALLRDAYLMLDQFRNLPDEKAIIKQLKDQLEEQELHRESMLRAKRSLEKEVEDLQQQLQDTDKARKDLEDRALAANRDKSELQSQLEDTEEEVAAMLKKCKALANQQSCDASVIAGQAADLSQVTEERDRLAKELSEVQARVGSTGDAIGRADLVKYEGRIRELEAKLDIETTSRTRLQSQLDRTKEQLEVLQDEKNALSSSESVEKEKCRRLQRQLREAKTELEEASTRLQDTDRRRVALSAEVEALREECQAGQSDLRLALRRIQDLQSALEEGLRDDTDVEAANSDLSECEVDMRSYGSKRASRDLRWSASSGLVSPASSSHGLNHHPESSNF